MPNDDPSALYRGIRGRITDLVRDLDEATLDRNAPATPAWTVHDVVAHLVGGVTDIVEGTLEGVASDPWTQAQVDRRRGVPIADLLDEWERGAVVVEPMIGDFPAMMRTMALIDAVTHEHDIRHAIGAPGARDSEAIVFAYDRTTAPLGAARGDLGAVRIVHEAGEDIHGEGEPTATVRTTRFEIVRAAVGRRAVEEIAAWDWDGDPTPAAFVLDRFSPPRATPLGE